MELITIIKDLAIAGAAIVTGTVAIMGLNSWRKEVQGKAEFETARALIASSYKLRDEIAFCRAPFIRAHEFPEGYVPLSGRENAQKEAEAWAHMYTNRLRPVFEALQEFDANSLEGEVLWGLRCRKATDALRQCVSELNTAIEATITNKAQGGEDFAADKDFGIKMRRITSATRSEENEFSGRITSAVQNIESEVRPHLKHS